MAFRALVLAARNLVAGLFRLWSAHRMQARGIAAVLAGCALLAACGSDDHARTPSATETAYELTENSRLQLSDGTEESAQGRFTVSSCERGAPNTYYCYQIDAIMIDSESFVIRTGNEPGRLDARTITPENEVSFRAAVSVNGMSGRLDGYGPIDDRVTGATLIIDLTSEFFSLHLEAFRF